MNIQNTKKQTNTQNDEEKKSTKEQNASIEEMKYSPKT